MYRSVYTVLVAAMLMIAAAAEAGVKKDVPTSSEVKKAIAALPAEMGFPEKSKGSKIGSVEPEDDIYFHVFSCFVKNRDYGIEEYRTLVFDNKGNILGYYPSNEEALEVEEAGIVYQSSDGQDTYVVDITAKGPAKTGEIEDGTIVFVPVPKKK